MFAIVVAFIATCAITGMVRVLWRTFRDAADEHRRRSRVEAVITLDDELLVALKSTNPDESLWLHSHLSVTAVVILARWRDSRIAIHVIEDEGDIVLRPTATQIGLRFRRQSPVSEVEVLRS